MDEMLHLDHHANGFETGHQKMSNANWQLHTVEQML